MMLNYRSLAVAMFAATGRIPEGTSSAGRAEGADAQALAFLGSGVDGAIDEAVRCAQRVQRDAADFLERVDAYGAPSTLDEINVRAAQDCATASAKARALGDVFEQLFSEMSGMHFGDAAIIVRRHMAPPSYLTPEWVAEAAGLLRLGKAMRDEAERLQRAARDAAEAARREAEAASERAKKDERARRAADRRAARAVAR